jgi:hypothetical protein
MQASRFLGGGFAPSSARLRETAEPTRLAVTSQMGRAALEATEPARQ